MRAKITIRTGFSIPPDPLQSDRTAAYPPIKRRRVAIASR
jgi:hypothetical protein